MLSMWPCSSDFEGKERTYGRRSGQLNASEAAIGSAHSPPVEAVGGVKLRPFVALHVSWHSTTSACRTPDSVKAPLRRRITILRTEL